MKYQMCGDRQAHKCQAKRVFTKTSFRRRQEKLFSPEAFVASPHCFAQDLSPTVGTEGTQGCPTMWAHEN